MAYEASAEFKTIVVATDLSRTSSAALQYARILASAYGARVVLAHVIDPMSYANLSNVPQQVMEEMTDVARGEMDRLAEEFLSEGIPSNSEVRQGVVTHLLLQVIDQYKADLLILGTRGSKGIGPVAVGTVAEQLVRLAPCPVMAVAADVIGASEEALAGGEILVPIESSAAADRAVAAARSLATHLRGGVILLHARTAAEAAANTNPCVATAENTSADKPDAGVAVRCVVKDGSPSDVIAAAAAEYRISMIVLAVNRESRTGTAHGTAYEVIARARTPVLFIPPAAVVAGKRIPVERAGTPC